MSEWKEFNLKSNDISTNQGFLQLLDLKNDFKYGMDLKRKKRDWLVFREVPNQGEWGTEEGGGGVRENKIWNRFKFLKHYLKTVNGFSCISNQMFQNSF